MPKVSGLVLINSYHILGPGDTPGSVPSALHELTHSILSTTLCGWLYILIFFFFSNVETRSKMVKGSAFDESFGNSCQVILEEREMGKRRSCSGKYRHR